MDYRKIIKAGVAMLQELIKNLEDYHPGDSLAGEHLAGGVRSRLTEAAEVLVKMEAASRKGGQHLNQFFMKYMAAEEQRHLGHIRSEVHEVLGRVCRAVEGCTQVESKQSWQADATNHLFRLAREESERRRIERIQGKPGD
jgi:hypothetical protein